MMEAFQGCDSDIIGHLSTSVVKHGGSVTRRSDLSGHIQQTRRSAVPAVGCEVKIL